MYSLSPSGQRPSHFESLILRPYPTGCWFLKVRTFKVSHSVLHIPTLLQIIFWSVHEYNYGSRIILMKWNIVGKTEKICYKNISEILIILKSMRLHFRPTKTCLFSSFKNSKSSFCQYLWSKIESGASSLHKIKLAKNNSESEWKLIPRIKTYLRVLKCIAHKINRKIQRKFSY